MPTNRFKRLIPAALTGASLAVILISTSVTASAANGRAQAHLAATAAATASSGSGGTNHAVATAAATVAVGTVDATEAPTAAADVAPVTSNKDWKPQIEAKGGIEMALVPPGCFMMGNDFGPSEQPRTKICFDKPFWIDKFEVTNAQFKKLGGVAKHAGYWNDAQKPRESIAWTEAGAFCKLRNGRLPTEAEWEWAARGPDNLDYTWGNTWDPNAMVYALNSGFKAAVVGTKPTGVSWIGTLDMIGNVWEQTSSLYLPYPYDATDGREDPTNNKTPRVMRGGGFLNYRFTRTELRGYVYPGAVAAESGFRCAMDAQ